MVASTRPAPEREEDDDAEYTRLKNKVDEQNEEIERLQVAILEHEARANKIHELQNDIETRTRKICDLQQDLEKLFNDYEERGKQLKRNDALKAKTDKELGDLWQELKERNEELGLCYKRLTAVNTSNDKLERQLNNAKNVLRLANLRARDAPEPKRYRSANTQSQCTYRRDLAQPRFQPISSFHEPVVTTTDEFSQLDASSHSRSSRSTGTGG